jgi:anti-sigma B factor antagonist
MELTVDRAGDVAVVMLPVEELTAGSSRDFKRDITPSLDIHPKMVLDLSRLQYVDSSGLGVFIWCLRRANANGGDLKFCGVTDRVRATLELVRLNRVLDLYPTRDEAIQAFRAPELT